MLAMTPNGNIFDDRRKSERRKVNEKVEVDRRVKDRRKSNTNEKKDKK